MYNPENVFQHSFDVESGYEMMTKAIEKLADNLPTAFLLQMIR